MSSIRSIDPYTVRYVSLGSGSHERSSKCGCNYRTGNMRRGTCYTTLQNEPPITNYERQRAGNLFQRTEAPLVRCLTREPRETSSRMSHIKKKRPFSAAACSRVDQNLPLVADGLIAVKGNNMHYQTRPLGRRASESMMNDKVIQSINDATSEEIQRMSSLFSDCNLVPIPKPPCPSPEQDVYLKFDSNGSEYSSTMAEEQSKSSLIQDQESSMSPTENEMLNDSTSDLNTSDKEDMNDVEFSQPTDTLNITEGSKPASKRVLQFKVPTGQEDDAFVVDEKCHSDVPFVTNTTRSCTEVQQKIPKYKSDTRVSLMKKTCTRPFSANAALGSTIKAKKIEFIDDKQLSTPNVVISNRTLETLLYMDYLQEKKKSTNIVKEIEHSKEKKCRSKEMEGKRSTKTVMCSEIPKEQKIENPPEIKVTSNTALARINYNSNHENADIKIKTVVEPLDEKMPHEKNENILESRTQTKTGNSNKQKFKDKSKLLKRQDIDPKRGIQSHKNETSMIWRSITGIDNLSSQTSKQKSKDEQHTNENTAPVDKQDSILLNRMGANTEKSKVVNSRSTKSAHVDFCLDKHGLSKDEYKVDSSENPQSRASSVLKRTNDDKNKKSLAEKQKSIIVDRKIMRPTSAVILRYMKEKEVNDFDKKPRPGSSRVKNQRTLTQRPKSAAVERANRRNSQTSGMKVVSSHNLNLTLRNGRDTATTTKKSGKQTRNTGRPISASSSKSKRPISAPIRTAKEAPKVSVLDITQEEKEISEECFNVLNSCKKQGIAISMETIKRALMPPCETAKPYSSTNIPHSSRLLIKPNSWLNTST